MKSILGITLGFLFHATLVVDAFSVPPCLSRNCHSVPVIDDTGARMFPTMTSSLEHRQPTFLYLSKRKGVETATKEENGLDYGKIISTFFNPGNPYSWMTITSMCLQEISGETVTWSSHQAAYNPSKVRARITARF